MAPRGDAPAEEKGGNGNLNKYGPGISRAALFWVLIGWIAPKLRFLALLFQPFVSLQRSK